MQTIMSTGWVEREAMKLLLELLRDAIQEEAKGARLVAILALLIVLTMTVPRLWYG